MPEFDVTAQLTGVDFGARGVAEVLQNVRTILTTARYSVPLDRQFGINADMLDEPLPRAKAKLSAEIIAAIRRYEPRARVTRISFSGDGMEGRLIPTVRVYVDIE